MCRVDRSFEDLPDVVPSRYSPATSIRATYAAYPKPIDPFTPRIKEGTDAPQIVGKAEARCDRHPRAPGLTRRFLPRRQDSAARTWWLVRVRPRSSFQACICIRDERRLPGTPAGRHEEVFQYDGGISEFVEFLAHGRRVTDLAFQR